jgi:hypothetical protein
LRGEEVVESVEVGMKGSNVEESLRVKGLEGSELGEEGGGGRRSGEGEEGGEVSEDEEGSESEDGEGRGQWMTAEWMINPQCVDAFVDRCPS